MLAEQQVPTAHAAGEKPNNKLLFTCPECRTFFSHAESATHPARPEQVCRVTDDLHPSGLAHPGLGATHVRLHTSFLVQFHKIGRVLQEADCCCWRLPGAHSGPASGRESRRCASLRTHCLPLAFYGEPLAKCQLCLASRLLPKTALAGIEPPAHACACVHRRLAWQNCGCQNTRLRMSEYSCLPTPPCSGLLDSVCRGHALSMRVRQGHTQGPQRHRVTHC